MASDEKTMRLLLERHQVCEPGPLGLAAFAFTVFILSAHNAGWAPDVIWTGSALFYGGLVLLLAGMWEFKKNNVFGATGFSTFGGFWMGLGFFVVLRLVGVVPASVDVAEAFGWYLTAILIFTTYMTVTSLLLPKVVFAAFFTTEITIILLMIGNFTKSPSWVKAGGYSGIVTSAAAWYASFAFLFNLTAKRLVFPIGKPYICFAECGPSLKDDVDV